LPSACRHFPRQFLRDPRGTFISLSHFCPTAANLLHGREPLQVVDAAPPLLIAEPIEGLDACDALPPLLRPGVLCDMNGYTTWEREGVAVLARADVTWAEALDHIAAATDRLRAWTPEKGALAVCVGNAFQDESADAGPQAPRDQDLVAIVSQLAAGRAAGGPHPIADFDRLWNDRVGRAFDRHDAAMKNFLAARLFANWIAYQGRGLRSIVHWLRTAAALVRHYTLQRVLDSPHEPGPGDFIEAIRTTDLLLLHVIDTQAFAHAVAPLA
jgi:hypothetical protein